MRVRILLDTVDYKAGREVSMDDFLARRWIETGLAEPIGEPVTPAPRAMPAPENKALEAPQNMAVKPKRTRKKV